MTAASVAALAGAFVVTAGACALLGRRSTPRQDGSFQAVFAGMALKTAGRTVIVLAVVTLGGWVFRDHAAWIVLGTLVGWLVTLVADYRRRT